MNIMYSIGNPVDGKASICTFEVNGEVWSLMDDETLFVDVFDDYFLDAFDW